MLILFPFWLNLPRGKRAPGNLVVHVFRAVISLIGGGATLYAVLHLPLSSANVIFYTSPLITILFANLLFNEPLLKRRISVIVIGFIGVLIALRPEEINLGAVAALTTATAVCLFNLSVRWLPRQLNATSVVFWTTACTLPFSAVLAVLYWQPITINLVILSSGTCLCYWLYHIACTYAYGKAEAGSVVIAEYSGLPFAFLLGWLIFDEQFTLMSFLGIGIIMAALIAHTLWEKHNKLSSSQLK